MLEPLKLPYDWSSLEPYISGRTMDVHYHRHYLSYLNQLNTLIVESQVPINFPISNLFTSLDIFPMKNQDAILYNAGGVLNHELFFMELSPTPNKNIPEPLNSAICKKFGTLTNFRERFIEYAKALKGSGYTFLAVDAKGDLVLLNLANQESPYKLGWIPIMNLDVWEHAYYLDRLNERMTYIHAFFEVLDYNKVNKNYQNALNQIKTS